MKKEDNGTSPAPPFLALPSRDRWPYKPHIWLWMIKYMTENACPEPLTVAGLSRVLHRKMREPGMTASAIADELYSDHQNIQCLLLVIRLDESLQPSLDKVNGDKYRITPAALKELAELPCEKQREVWGLVLKKLEELRSDPKTERESATSVLMGILGKLTHRRVRINYQLRK